MPAGTAKRLARMKTFSLLWLWLTSSEFRLMRRAYQAIEEKRQEDLR